MWGECGHAMVSLCHYRDLPRDLARTLAAVRAAEGRPKVMPNSIVSARRGRLGGVGGIRA